MTEPPAELNVRTREASDGTVVVEVSGDLVVTNRDALLETLEEILERGRGAIVSCSELDHIDTPSLALLVQARWRFSENGARFAVAALPPRFSDLVKDMRIREGLPLLDTVEEGLGPGTA